MNDDITRRGEKAASVQTAEEFARGLLRHGIFDCGLQDCKACPEHLKAWVRDIEAAFAAQRQAGREEADKEIKRYEAFAERRIAKIGSDIEALNYRYAALVEAARPFAQYEDGDAGKCWGPSRIKLGKALSDLEGK